MSDFVRIEDNDTGAKVTVGRDLADLYVEQGVAKVLKDDAVDPLFGTVLPTELPASSNSKATTAAAKKGDH